MHLPLGWPDLPLKAYCSSRPEVVFLLASRKETKWWSLPEAACRRRARRLYRKCPDCSSRPEVVFLLVSRREAK